MKNLKNKLVMTVVGFICMSFGYLFLETANPLMALGVFVLAFTVFTVSFFSKD